MRRTGPFRVDEIRVANEGKINVDGSGKRATGFTFVDPRTVEVREAARQGERAQERGSSRVDWPVYPRRVELNTVAEGGTRRWVEPAVPVPFGHLRPRVRRAGGRPSS